MKDTTAAAERGAGTGADPWMRHSWVMAALWLVFIFYPILALATSTADAGPKTLGWVGLAVFVVVYLISFRLGGNTGVTGDRPLKRTWWFFALAVLAVVATVPAAGGGAASFLPFVVTIPAYQLPRWFFFTVSGLSVVGLTAYTTVTNTWEDNLSLLIILVVICLVHTVSVWLIRRSIHADRLSHDLVASEERGAVARDVHDLLGHSLTVVKLKTQLARRLVRVDPDRAEAELDELDALVGEAIAGVRATVTGLRSDGLPAQLASAKGTLQQTGIQVDVVGEDSSLSPAQSLVAAWILREATTNTLRHADATRVRIGLAPGRFSFDDDGVGLPKDAHDHGGNGISGMNERASVSGANLALTSSPELGGTRVELTW